MSQGPRAVYTTTLASNVTLSSELDLTRAWKTVYIEIPTMASGDIYIQGAAVTGGTFRRVGIFQVTTATAASFPDFKIASTTTQRMVPLPAAVAALQYIKVESSSGCTQVVTTYNLICAD